MTASAGIVKWFGGYNKTKGVENKFGFLEDMSGSDVFLHESEWLGNDKPKEGQFIYFELEENKGKWSARQARYLIELSHAQLIELISRAKDRPPSMPHAQIKKSIASWISCALTSCDRPEIESLIEIQGQQNFISMLVPEREWPQNLDFLTEKGLVSPLKDIDWVSLPPQYLVYHAEETANYLQSLEKSEAIRVVEASLYNLPSDLKLFALLAGYIEDSAALTTVKESIESYAVKIYSENRQQPDYLRKYIKSQTLRGAGIMQNHITQPIFSYYQFKKYLFEKNPKFISLYEQSASLQSGLDTFILTELFSLILAGNTLDTVYSLFMGRLWEAICSGKINPLKQAEEILKLFPSCQSFSRDFSCEAVHWEKQNIYLCRGRKCINPRVTPNLGTNYSEFTIYDWFAHYGINYQADKKPTKHDFPIKLAGYFNRLREIFEVIHCRGCSSLMLPDLRYARVQYTAIEKGKPVKKDIAPAYRLTVFKCANKTCTEYELGHYINHCMGHECYCIIDSRESSMKCDAGRYICRSCASCCGDHAKSNPIGLCPDCAAPLNLYESQSYDTLRKRYNRYVQCSNANCSFTIETDGLTKRFYLPSCEPVIRQDQPEWITD